MGTPKPLTPAQMREAAGLGPEWQVIWAGADPFADHEHLCGGPYGPGGTHTSGWARMPYAPTGTPGLQVAKCERCRMASVRAVPGSKESPPAA